MPLHINTAFEACVFPDRFILAQRSFATLTPDQVQPTRRYVYGSRRPLPSSSFNRGIESSLSILFACSEDSIPSRVFRTFIDFVRAEHYAHHDVVVQLEVAALFAGTVEGKFEVRDLLDLTEAHGTDGDGC